MKPKRYSRGIIRPTRQGTFSAEVNANYKRHRKVLPTMVLAKDWIDRTVNGIDRSNKPLDAFSYEDARRAVAMLPHGVTLSELAKQYIESQSHVKVSLDTAIDRLLSEKEAAGLRQTTTEDLRWKLKRFLAYVGDVAVGDVTGDMLVEWMDNAKLQGVTRRNYRAAFHNLFAWCMKAGYVNRNPAELITIPKVDLEAPGILTVKEARELLVTAEREDADLCPFFSIGMFAGLRTIELKRLDFSQVKPEHIHVKSKVAKTRQERYVTIGTNLSQWIEKHGREKGPIVPTNFRTRYGRVRAAAGMTKWPPNALRHSFATYHLALYQNAAQTSHELGQLSAHVLYNHYRNLATKKEAEAYFKIHPSGV